MASERRATASAPRARLRGNTAALLAALFLIPAAAWAQAVGTGKVPSTEPAPSAADRARADALLKSGEAKLAAGDANGALADYLAADSILGTPVTRVGVGKAQAGMGQLLEANETLGGVKRMPVAVAEPAAFKDARDEAERLSAALFERVPRLTLVVSGLPQGTAASVTVDHEPLRPEQLAVALPLNPGEHSIIAKATGFAPIEQQIKLAERERRNLDLAFQPIVAAAPPAPKPTPLPPSAPPAPSAEPSDADSGVSPALWVGVGVAAAGIVAGTVAGIVAGSRASDLKERCRDNRCLRADTESDYDRATLAAHVSTAGFTVAGTGLLLSLVGALYTAWSTGAKPPPLESAAVEPVISLGAAGLRGRF